MSPFVLKVTEQIVAMTVQRSEEDTEASLML